MKVKRIMSEAITFTTIDTGTGCYLLTSTDKTRLLKLDATCKCYLALMAGNAYKPASGEKITVILKGKLS
jgi:hypothetical protein